MATDLEKITPPKSLTDEQKGVVFQHFFRRLADYRNFAVLYGTLECSLAAGNDEDALKKQDEFESEISRWAQQLLEKAWIACNGDDTGVFYMTVSTIQCHLNIMCSEMSKTRPLHRYSYS